jgi:cation diffusion facilitator CzcD-associated flavoprotein CzcO
MKLLQRMAERHLHRQVQDPWLRRELTPNYLFGCKRILISNDFYPAVASPKVQLVTAGIREVQPDGIVTADGTERRVDAIILGTGFKAADPVPRGMVFGRQGRDLGELWADGPEAYKGTTVAGFPNLFLLMGPNTGLGHSSMVYMIESQIRYVMDALRRMKRNGLHTVEMKPETQQAWNERVQQRLAGTVWNAGGCGSWYLHPVSGRNVTLWPGFTWQFRLQTRRFDLNAYAVTRQAARAPVPASRVAVPNQEW